jgi:hypothetical protein
MATSQVPTARDLDRAPRDVAGTLGIAGPPLPCQCGRCRLFFAGDPGASTSAPAAWWLCPRCRVALLGSDPPRH